jgi:hypothetical protein
MIKQFGGRAALVALALSAALVLPACSDPAAKAKAEAEAKAKSEAAQAERKLRDKIKHNVECLSALKWQQAALAGAGIGPLDTYTGYYRTNIERALGSQALAAAPPAPELSIATLDAYLAWAYPEDVKNSFTAGKDNNGDGTVSGFERSGRGFTTVSACILEVAETGNGPLAGKDKVGRVGRIQEIQAKLKDKDA